MAFRSSKQARAYVGRLDASCYARTASVDSPTEMLDTTTLCDTAKAFIVGDEESSFSVAGPLDTDATADAQYDAITDIKASTTPIPITYMPLGTDGAAWLMDANETNIGFSGGVGSTVDWSVEAQTTGQTDYNGTVLSNAAAVTATANGASVDGGAATANGAVAHLHVTAYTGLTSDTITIEDSSTGSSGWATIGTFAAATGVTSERITIAGAVRRYVRVVDTVVGAGSTTRTVAMSRR